jgi:hypothetical protein
MCLPECVVDLKAATEREERSFLEISIFANSGQGITKSPTENPPNLTSAVTSGDGTTI